MGSSLGYQTDTECIGAQQFWACRPNSPVSALCWLALANQRSTHALVRFLRCSLRKSPVPDGAMIDQELPEESLTHRSLRCQTAHRLLVDKVHHPSLYRHDRICGQHFDVPWSREANLYHFFNTAGPRGHEVDTSPRRIGASISRVMNSRVLCDCCQISSNRSCMRDASGCRGRQRAHPSAGSPDPWPTPALARRAALPPK